VDVVNGAVDDEELEAELEALGDELAMEEELKEEEGTVPRYPDLLVDTNHAAIWRE